MDDEKIDVLSVKCPMPFSLQGTLLLRSAVPALVFAFPEIVLQQEIADTRDVTLVFCTAFTHAPYSWLLLPSALAAHIRGLGKCPQRRSG
jgi:hypothetical protein